MSKKFININAVYFKNITKLVPWLQYTTVYSKYRNVEKRDLSVSVLLHK